MNPDPRYIEAAEKLLGEAFAMSGVYLSGTPTPTSVEHVAKKLAAVIAETTSRAEQSCRYVLKHADFTDASPNYREGWTGATKLCETAIASHIERHLPDILSAGANPAAGIA
jgi:hypothetical protein